MENQNSMTNVVSINAIEDKNFEKYIMSINFYSNGRLTEPIVDRLRRKINELGITKDTAARRIGITLSNLMKWLSGNVKNCQQPVRDPLVQFLCGKYDVTLQKIAQHKGQRLCKKHNGQKEKYPDKLILCLERLSRMYSMCARSSQEYAEAFAESLSSESILLMHYIMQRIY